MEGDRIVVANRPMPMIRATHSDHAISFPDRELDDRQGDTAGIGLGATESSVAAAGATTRPEAATTSDATAVTGT